ncbi:PKD domain-containing protein [Sphingobacterium alkalisoli]|uniref:PKD domain-containing protein n=1 Tax=Sphingobacterium alkalisoli TaxID=1874115 RepID=A0A4U0GYH3_9SPHI|nr:PKD domain-containing protein [Sphingobacterium alkalisoli]TJY64257.1 PKD domain-containing protein [Sphingobacterium alkalisoli]GGH22855.1 hypothetical protein GCM10011418_29720 [Sphingobacterium alkalisoli]
MNYWFTALYLLLIPHLSVAQVDSSLIEQDTFVSVIHTDIIGNKIAFKSALRPLVQVPGGRAPFYTYLWDFGDGHFSTAAEPIHQYQKVGDYEVTVYAVNNYDDGRKPKRPKKKVTVSSAIASRDTSSSPFEESFFTSNGIFQLFKNSDAKPGEDMALVVGVNTNGKKGKVLLLTNEKAAGLDGFMLAGQSKYYNERVDSILHNKEINSLWANVKQSTFTKTGSPDYGIKEQKTFSSSSEAIAYFSELHMAYNSLATYEIDGSQSETQFSLINLDITEDMLVDTNAIVTITGVFIPEDGIANVHQLDVPVVKSHDPNKMSIRPARMNYRFQKKNKELTYKVQFQNDGEGDAKNIRLEMFLPAEVDLKTFKLQSLYPKCDSCLTTNARGCYQYDIKEDGTLTFHFKDISLPGTGAADITDQDSTKGFILFTVQTDKKLKNKAFKSYTNIYFDKNPPIKTNNATSRFRRIYSPLVTVGASRTFGTPTKNDIQYKFKPGIQIGLGIAPIAPYRKPYWQAEVYTSYYKEEAAQSIVEEGVVQYLDENGRNTEAKYTSYERNSNKSFMTIQVPVQIRININSFLSTGAGVSLRTDLNLKNEESVSYNTVTANGEISQVVLPSDVEKDKMSPIKINPFWDINVGRVYLGPALGIRIAYDTHQKANAGIYGIWRF